MDRSGYVQSTCGICSRNDAQRSVVVGFSNIKCQKCGDYCRPEDWLELPTDEARVRLSGYVRNQNIVGIKPRITIDLARTIIARARPTLMERARQALTVIARKAPSMERYDNALLNDPEMRAITYSLDADDVYILVRLLNADGLVEIDPNPKQFRITPKGLVAAEEMSKTAPSAQAFVAMAFDPSMDDVWTYGFDEGIKKAGYEPVRIDKKEHVNGISDEIMAEIRRSKFVIADYTGNVNGVYL